MNNRCLVEENNVVFYEYFNVYGIVEILVVSVQVWVKKIITILVRWPLWFSSYF
jgi:uncharacterized membrane protein